MLRYLDPSEHYFWLLDQVSSMNFAVVAEFDQLKTTQEIADAFKALQAEQSIFKLAVGSDSEGRLFFQKHRQQIALETFDDCDNWQHVVEAKLAERFEQGQPLVRALYCQSRHENSQLGSIVLLFNHAVADGRTGTELLKQWLDIISGQLPRGSEVDIEGMHQKIPTTLDITDQPGRIAEYKERKKSEITRFGRIDHLPKPLPKAEGQSAGGSQPKIISYEFTAEQSARISRLCKEHGLRVHSALTAAQLLSIYQNEAQEEATLCLTSPVDMRRYYNEEQVTLGMHTALLTSAFNVTSSSDFWSIAQQANKELHSQIHRDDPAYYYQLIRPELIPCNEAGLDGFTRATLRSPANSLISNLGILSPGVNNDVQRISFALCPMPFQPLFTAVTHFRGKLQINITYDAEVIDSDSARNIAKDIYRLLSQL